MKEERNPPAVTIRLRQEIADQIEQMAREDGLTPTAVCRQAIHRQVNAPRRQTDSSRKETIPQKKLSVPRIWS
jgi:predicted transcriptional regulator